MICIYDMPIADNKQNHDLVQYMLKNSLRSIYNFVQCQIRDKKALFGDRKVE